MKIGDILVPEGEPYRLLVTNMFHGEDETDDGEMATSAVAVEISPEGRLVTDRWHVLDLDRICVSLETIH